MRWNSSLCAFVTLVAIASASGRAAAQTEAPADTLVVPVSGVEVTALRGRDRLQEIPAAAFVLSRDDIWRAGSPRLSSLLQSIPGLFAYGQTSSGDATIVDPRGFSASGESSYLKLLVDGQDVRDLENGNVDWDWVPPGDIERIEVVQGPGAWIYGDASEGGIVNVVRTPPGARLGSSLDARVGSFGLRTGSLGVSGPAGGAEVGARGFARGVDGWRERSRERVYGGSGEVVMPWGARQVTIEASGLDTDRQDPGAITSTAWAVDPKQADSQIDYTRSRRGRLALRVQSAPGPEPSWALTPHVRGEDVDQVRTDPYQPATFHHTEGATGGASLEWRGRRALAARPVVLQGVAEFEHAGLRSDYSGYDPNAGRDTLLADGHSWRTLGSASLSARVELSPRTVARLSVRGDLARVHMFDAKTRTTSRTRSLSAVSPLLGVTREVGTHGAVFASASTAFRVPTLAQLYGQRPLFLAPGLTQPLSNAELDPQRATSLEGGFRWDRNDGASAQLAGYWTWVRNEIDFDSNTFQYVNIARSLHRGLEGRVSCPLPARFSAQLGGAWTPTTFDGGASDGRQINGVPLGTGNAALAWSPVSAASAEVGARYIGRRFLDKDEAHPLGQVVTWDAGLQGRWGRVRGSVRVLNVFDKRYAESGYFIDFLGDERLLPAAPRSVNVALSI
jgi:outer membrane receptor protein involved in Fe transport